MDSWTDLKNDRTDVFTLMTLKVTIPGRAEHQPIWGEIWCSTWINNYIMSLSLFEIKERTKPNTAIYYFYQSSSNGLCPFGRLRTRLTSTTVFNFSGIVYNIQHLTHLAKGCSIVKWFHFSRKRILFGKIFALRSPSERTVSHWKVPMVLGIKLV